MNAGNVISERLILKLRACPRTLLGVSKYEPCPQTKPKLYVCPVRNSPFYVLLLKFGTKGTKKLNKLLF